VIHFSSLTDILSEEKGPLKRQVSHSEPVAKKMRVESSVVILHSEFTIKGKKRLGVRLKPNGYPTTKKATTIKLAKSKG
jgi:hypothetical protein